MFHILFAVPARRGIKVSISGRMGNTFFSHITEIIRLATLWKYGGVYLDTDVVVMRELDNLHNAVGTS